MPVQVALSLVAALLSAMVFTRPMFSGLPDWRAPVRKFGLAAVLLVPIGVLALLSALHARGSVELGWLFGTETSDIGPVEFGTVFCFAAALVPILKMAGRATGPDRIVYALMAAACLFIAGEELSWGQWLFHWETPAQLASVNLQQETNLHNMVDPRIYDPIYSLVSFLLIGLALVASAPSLKARVLKVIEGVPGLSPLTAFIEWLSGSTIGLALTLATAVLLQHESFEEFAELLLGLTLMNFMAASVSIRHET